MMNPPTSTALISLLTSPFAVLSIVLAFVTFFFTRLRRSRVPKLKGPVKTHSVFGVAKDLFSSPDPGAIYEAWERAYGPVYAIPVSLGATRIVLCDPKAIAHIFANDTMTYRRPDGTLIRRILGDILLVMEGEVHKRQRRALSPAFSVSAIRSLIDVFVNSSRKLQAQWDQMLKQQSDTSESVTIDVQKWMNYVSLDSIGNGGFSHDFGALSGRPSPVLAAFDSFGSLQPSILNTLPILIGARFPFIFTKIPNKRTRMTQQLIKSMRQIARQLLEKVGKEYEESGKEIDRSMIGTLIKSEHASEKIRLSVDEIMAQNLLLIAGYEATAVTLTWGLIELCRHPDIQEKLRVELRDNLDRDQEPTYDQLQNGLPYLDAFTSEVLRLHSAQPEANRVTTCDDIIPLTRPIATASGAVIDTLFIPKGTIVRIPFAGVNKSEALWGKNAANFDPQRWLSGDRQMEDEHDVKDGDMKDAMQGYRHLLTFGSGPRMCLGRNFALTEFKVVLSLLVLRYSFALPDGPETKLENHRSILMRPKVVGEEGPRVPLVIQKLEW